jgi:hypothetical protein
MGTDLTYGTAYHLQTNGQTERVNQILEEMLQACVLIYEKKWVTCLPFAEFSYNNSYQASIKISPFEALYGRWCRTPTIGLSPGKGLSLARICFWMPRTKSKLSVRISVLLNLAKRIMPIVVAVNTNSKWAIMSISWSFRSRAVVVSK